MNPVAKVPVDRLPSRHHHPPAHTPRPSIKPIVAMFVRCTYSREETYDEDAWIYDGSEDGEAAGLKAARLEEFGQGDELEWDEEEREEDDARTFGGAQDVEEEEEEEMGGEEAEESGPAHEGAAPRSERPFCFSVSLTREQIQRAVRHGWPSDQVAYAGEPAGEGVDEMVVQHEDQVDKEEGEEEEGEEEEEQECGDDGTVCADCGVGEDEEGNEILLCDGEGCERAFHQRCLPAPLDAVPDGEWLCPWCAGRGDRTCA